MTLCVLSKIFKCTFFFVQEIPSNRIHPGSGLGFEPRVIELWFKSLQLSVFSFMSSDADRFSFLALLPHTI